MRRAFALANEPSNVQERCYLCLRLRYSDVCLHGACSYHAPTSSCPLQQPLFLVPPEPSPSHSLSIISIRRVSTLTLRDGAGITDVNSQGTNCLHVCTARAMETSQRGRHQPGLGLHQQFVARRYRSGIMFGARCNRHDN